MKNKNLENLRGVAILFVLITHSFFIEQLNVFRDFFDFSRGVDLFFILSGFLMGTTYISRIDLDKFCITEAYNFYIKRISRLAPAVIFWSVLTLILSPFFIYDENIFKNEKMALSHFSSNILFIGNLYNAHYENALGYWWSIGVEFQFYIILPILVYVAGKSIYKIFLTIIIVLSLPYIWNIDNSWMFRFNCLFIGIILWRITTTSFYDELSLKINSIRYVTILIISAFFIFCLLISSKSLSEYSPALSTISGVVFGTILLVFYALRDDIFGRVVGAVFQYLGKISFSLYLSHILVFIISVDVVSCFKLKKEFLFLAYPCSIYIAHLSVKYIESNKFLRKMLI